MGDSVFGLDGTDIGAYAEYKTMREDRGLQLKPDGLSYLEAAFIPNGAMTAYTFLVKMGTIQRGQTVLIYGASGSIGTAAVQIAKHYGAEVTAVCSGRNHDLVQSLGADKVIDYTKEDYRQGGETYDIILDTVGKSPFQSCKQVLKSGGQYLAPQGGMREMVQMMRTSLLGNKKVKAGVSSEDKADLAVIKEMLEAGALKPVIDRCYPLEEIVEAHRYADTRRKRGNIAIQVVPSGVDDRGI